MHRSRRQTFKENIPPLLCASSNFDEKGSKAVQSTGIEGRLAEPRTRGCKTESLTPATLLKRPPTLIRPLDGSISGARETI